MAVVSDEWPPGRPATTAPPTEDRLAAKLRGFGPLGTVAALVIVALGPIIEPLGALLVPWWARRSGTPWRELGFVRPKSWLLTVAVAVVLGSAFKIVMKALVMPLLGAPAINPAFHYLVGNTAALPEMFFAVIVGAGFGEETVYRGFAFERLGKLFGPGMRARVAIVLLTASWFGLIHYPVQGLAGVEQATIVGLVYGSIFAATGRIWPLIFAHAAFDVTAVLLIYWNLEGDVAHLLFR